MLFSSLETSIQEKAPGRKLPYTRFELGVTPVLDSLPEGMENVPLQVWTDFWSRIDVMAKQVNRLDKMALLIYMLVVGIVSYLFLKFVPTASPTEAMLFLLAFIAPLLAGLLYFKAYNFKKLKTFCSEEEAQTFLPFGFVLECHDELTTDYPNGHYYLYFIPSMRNGNCNDEMPPDGMCCHRGYLRVQVLKDLSWNTSPALPYYDYLPSGIVSVSLADWSEFWTMVDALSSAAVSFKRGMYLIGLMCFIALLTMCSNLENTIAVRVSFIFTCWLSICLTYYTVRYHSQVSDLENVCNEYADRFRWQGVYMEFRTEQTETGVVHYCIYLFPVMHPN